MLKGLPYLSPSSTSSFPSYFSSSFSLSQAGIISTAFEVAISTAVIMV